VTLEIALFVALFALYSWALVRLGRTMGERTPEAARVRAANQKRAYDKGVTDGVATGWRECEERRQRIASAAATRGWQKRRTSDAPPQLVEGATHG